MPKMIALAGPLVALLALAACTTPGTEGISPASIEREDRRPIWHEVEGRATPTLMFGTLLSGESLFRLSCDGAGTRLATFVNGVPRGVTADAESFPTRLRLFLGRTEYDLGATGTPLAGGGSMVESLLPDPDAFFAALGAQGRLVAVTFAGRTKAPAPATEMVAGFRTRCAARG